MLRARPPAPPDEPGHRVADEQGEGGHLGTEPQRPEQCAAVGRVAEDLGVVAETDVAHDLVVLDAEERHDEERENRRDDGQRGNGGDRGERQPPRAGAGHHATR
jgi:hypothetical protein